MQQIADAAGVSTTTVSHTISGKRPVNPATAARVRQLIEQFEYVPNSGAVRLQSGRSGVIALAVPDIAHWYFGRIARGVELAADAADYGLIVCSTVNADPRREKRYVNLLRTRAADGLVYTTSRSNADIDDLVRHARTAPLVFADEAVPSLSEVPSVSSTLAEGARAAAAHLAALGHTRAVVIAGYPSLASTVERRDAFREFFPRALTLYGDFEHESGYAIVSDLLANGVTFTCIFAHNDLMALGAIRRLREEGLRVPEDVSVVGFDDVDVASLVSPGLTTVRKDLVETGRQAGKLLIAQLEGESEVESVVLPVELIVRETTAQENERALVRLQIADNEVARVQKEKEGQSLAELMQQKNQAAAIRVMAEAEAMRVRALGDAEAAAIQAKGEAEAEVLRKKAEAFKQYGEAALVEMIVEKLPEIAEKMAAPLAKTEKMVFVTSDGTSASKVTGDIGRMMAQLPEVVEGVTGVNINTAMQKLAGPAAGAFIASQMAK